MPFHRSHATVLGALVAVLLLPACSSGSPGQDATSARPASTPASPFIGAWGEEEVGAPSVTIAEDGSFNGTDGCNSLVGHGTFAGNTFQFGAFALTRMACMDVDDWFSGAHTATVDGDTLTVNGEDGREIGTLTRR